MPTEIVRVESGIPRTGAEITDDALASELGEWGENGISYQKGCYVGQETLNRIRSIGHVNRSLTGFFLEQPIDDGAVAVPLYADSKKVGLITSVARSFRLGKTIALGFARRDFRTPDTALEWRSASGAKGLATIAPLPFV